MTPNEAFTCQLANQSKNLVSSPEERIEKLIKLKEAIQDRRAEIAKALYQDFKKHPVEVDLTEVHTTLSEVSFAIKNLKKWMRPRKVKTPKELLGTSSKIIYQPKGRVLIIGPWNYPFSLVINPLAAALAAGNTAILKPSELTPHTTALIKQMIQDIFPPEEVAVFEGGVEMSQQLLELPFDHFFFTGSTPVGKIIMAAASKHLASVTLELGGKSPVIIDKSVNLKSACDRIVWGKFINGGQTCVAPDYVFVPTSLQNELVRGLSASIQRFYGKDETERKNSPDLARIINARNFERIKSLVERSVDKGARVALGAEFDADENYIAPTILTDVKADMPIMSEEIFGPVLPILTYDQLDHVYEYIADHDNPLALYVFGEDQNQLNQIIARTKSGGSCTNQTVLHLGNHHLPFGGAGPSGLGNYHGEFGFRAFSNERAVLHQGPLSAIGFTFPPYSEKVAGFVNKLIKFV